MGVNQDILDMFRELKNPTVNSFDKNITSKYKNIITQLNIGKMEVILDGDNKGKRMHVLHNTTFTNTPITQNFKIVGNENITINTYPKTEFNKNEIESIHFLNDVISVLYSKSRYTELLNYSQKTDIMTSAPNTLGIIEFGERLYEQDILKNYYCLFSNLKNFKYMNTKLGMDGGNKLLKKYFLEVNSLLSDNETFGRTGGDNFFAIIKNENIDSFIEKLQKIKITFNDEEFELPSRIGVYKIGEYDKMQEALEYASVANNVAKNTKINDIVYFTEDMQKKLLKEKEVLINFHPALQKEEFIIYYQPKINLANRKLKGAEALVRWIKPDEGMVSPGLFIPVLERGSEICELDLYVLKQVCRDLRKWLNDGIEPVRVSINISRNNLKNPHLSNRILNILDEYQIDRKYIELEITETSCYDDYVDLLNFIGNMHDNKIKVSIDDFGTGYSSINLLKELHADIVKIDKSLVDNIGSNNESDEIIIKNVVNMLNELNMEVVAEGVETIEQIDFLKTINCNTIQGYFFSKPITKKEYEEKLYKNEEW